MADEDLQSTGGTEDPGQDPQVKNEPTPGEGGLDAQQLQQQLAKAEGERDAANTQAKAERQKRVALQGEYQSYQQQQAPVPNEGQPLTQQDVAQITQQAIQQDREAIENQRVEDEFKTRLKTADAQYADVDVMEILSDDTLHVSGAMAAVIKQDDQGADLLVWLSQNRDKAEEISRLTPERAAVELGRISTGFNTDTGSKTTRAPDPITPLGGAGTVNKDEDNLSPSELEARLRDQRGGSVFPKENI